MFDVLLDRLAGGLLELPAWGVVVVTLLLTHVTIVSVTVFLHRHQAHRALDLHPAVAHFFRFWLWLTTGMMTKQWAAVHRKHHARVETDDDPHSPRRFGVNKVLWEGAELYRIEAANQETLDKFGYGTPDDWLEHHLYIRHAKLGLSLMFATDVLMFGAIGITVWAVQMAWIPFFAAGVVNGLGHHWGYRNFECPDASTNLIPWGLLIGGEELHNNHHAFASSAKLSSKWWEFDVGWLYIRILEIVGLAQVKKRASKPLRRTGKIGVDLDTVRALISNNMHIMARYAREVVGKVYREELRRTDGSTRDLLKPMKGLLTREDSRLDEHAKRHLQQALERSQALEVVYQFKLGLQALWKERTATHESLLQALQDWCRQAEETGIKALQEFARSLGAYTENTV